MEHLLISAMELAKEVSRGDWGEINDISQQPEVFRLIITELQQRKSGYELSEYVKAISYAIHSTELNKIK